MIEPGRSLVANAGVTLYTVESVKRLPGGARLVAVDGGMSDNPRPMLYDAVYDAEAADRFGATASRPRSSASTASPATCWCAARGCPRSSPATCSSPRSPAPTATRWPPTTTALRRPPVVFCGGGEARAVVRRETYEDLGARDL